MKIAVSILKSKLNEKETIELINKTDAEYIHVDVMDGKFVENKTAEYKFLHLSKKKLRVHLMVNNPLKYISYYSMLNTEIITFQSEIKEPIDELIEFTKTRGLKVGLAIKPETSIKNIEKYLKDIDEVIVMTVEPGKGGQKLMDSTLYKLDILKRLRKEKHLKFDICVDGGVNDETISKVKDADIVVSGSFICMSDDYNSQIKKLRNIIS